MDFWSVHGWGFLIAITFFPRLTLLLSSVATGGFFWWLGWLFLPRVLVAILGTIAYGATNPGLCALAWGIALFGEFTEKTGASKMRK